jgi:hypothetical protein
MWALGLIPLWGVVSRYSKNILIDGLLYDILMFLTYSISLCIFTKSWEKFTLINYIGLVGIIGGFICLKIK